MSACPPGPPPGPGTPHAVNGSPSAHCTTRAGGRQGPRACHPARPQEVVLDRGQTPGPHRQTVPRAVGQAPSLPAPTPRALRTRRRLCPQRGSHMPRLSLAAGGTTTSAQISGRTPGLRRRRRAFSKLMGGPTVRPPGDHPPALPAEDIAKALWPGPLAACPPPPQGAGQPLVGDFQALPGAHRQRDQEPLELLRTCQERQARPRCLPCIWHHLHFSFY